MALAAPDVRVLGLTTVAGNVGARAGDAQRARSPPRSAIPTSPSSRAPRRRWSARTSTRTGSTARTASATGTTRRRSRAPSASTPSTRSCASTRERPGLTLVTLGPLTNVALALARDPGARRADRPLRGDGRRALLRGQRHAGGRIQHLGRSGGGAGCVPLAAADRDGRLARLARRLRAERRRGRGDRGARHEKGALRHRVEQPRARRLSRPDRRGRPVARRSDGDGGRARPRRSGFHGRAAASRSRRRASSRAA